MAKGVKKHKETLKEDLEALLAQHRPGHKGFQLLVIERSGNIHQVARMDDVQAARLAVIALHTAMETLLSEK